MKYFLITRLYYSDSCAKQLPVVCLFASFTWLWLASTLLSSSGVSELKASDFSLHFAKSHYFTTFATSLKWVERRLFCLSPSACFGYFPQRLDHFRCLCAPWGCNRALFRTSQQTFRTCRACVEWFSVCFASSSSTPRWCSSWRTGLWLSCGAVCPKQ